MLVALCDLTIYRGHGFAGYALLFIAAPLLLARGSYRPHFGAGFWLLSLLLAALAAKMIWCGSALLVCLGFFLLVAFAMSLCGLCPYVLEVFVFASQTILGGYAGLIQYVRSLRRASVPVARVRWLNVLLPLATCVVFSLLFILANPDLLTAFGERVELLLNALRDWIIDFSPRPAEFVFWLAVLWIAVGLLRPVFRTSLPNTTWAEVQLVEGPAEKPAPVFVYSAFRNTLLTVIVLFAAYLIFEFKTLWFRVFPPGFYYSGYAHQGAAWLTVALALATVILSIVFRGRILLDPRLPHLRTLAWIWSLENMLLAVAVYHRMYIYIGFNGMTRMRMVGIFGMTAVVIGFVLVLGKIARNHDFLWLLRRQLWALGLTVYAFALTPVDSLVVGYNVQRILAGDPAPSVQISVHPIGSEGVLLLRPLLECRDSLIREGVRALLAQRQQEAEAAATRKQQLGWTTYQVADQLVWRGLRASSSEWSPYADRRSRDQALDRFHKYAYQWY